MYILLSISRMYVGTPLELIVGSATDIYIHTCIMTVHACCPTEIHLHTCMGVCAWHTMWVSARTDVHVPYKWIYVHVCAHLHIQHKSRKDMFQHKQRTSGQTKQYKLSVALVSMARVAGVLLTYSHDKGPTIPLVGIRTHTITMPVIIPLVLTTTREG